MRIRLNDRVKFKDNRTGTVRYIGCVNFAKGEWYGICLDDKFSGKNDGSIKGKRYFKCKRNKGTFVKKDKIAEILDGRRGAAAVSPNQEAKKEEKAEKFKVGMKVNCDNRVGVVRFVGELDFTPGEKWIGVELDPRYPGKNDGTAKGKRYFTCTPNQGVFLKPEKVDLWRGDISTGPSDATPASTSIPKQEPIPQTGRIRIPAPISTSPKKKVKRQQGRGIISKRQQEREQQENKLAELTVALEESERDKRRRQEEHRRQICEYREQLQDAQGKIKLVQQTASKEIGKLHEKLERIQDKIIFTENARIYADNELKSSERARQQLEREVKRLKQKIAVIEDHARKDRVVMNKERKMFLDEKRELREDRLNFAAREQELVNDRKRMAMELRKYETELEGLAAKYNIAQKQLTDAMNKVAQKDNENVELKRVQEELMLVRKDLMTETQGREEREMKMQEMQKNTLKEKHALETELLLTQQKVQMTEKELLQKAARTEAGALQLEQERAQLNEMKISLEKQRTEVESRVLVANERLKNLEEQRHKDKELMAEAKREIEHQRIRIMELQSAVDRDRNEFRAEKERFEMEPRYKHSRKKKRKEHKSSKRDSTSSSSFLLESDLKDFQTPQLDDKFSDILANLEGLKKEKYRDTLKKFPNSRARQNSTDILNKINAVRLHMETLRTNIDIAGEKESSQGSPLAYLDKENSLQNTKQFRFISRSVTPEEEQGYDYFKSQAVKDLDLDRYKNSMQSSEPVYNVQRTENFHSRPLKIPDPVPEHSKPYVETVVVSDFQKSRLEQKRSFSPDHISSELPQHPRWGKKKSLHETGDHTESNEGTQSQIKNVANSEVPRVSEQNQRHVHSGGLQKEKLKSALAEAELEIEKADSRPMTTNRLEAELPPDKPDTPASSRNLAPLHSENDPKELVEKEFSWKEAQVRGIMEWAASIKDALASLPVNPTTFREILATIAPSWTAKIKEKLAEIEELIKKQDAVMEKHRAIREQFSDRLWTWRDLWKECQRKLQELHQSSNERISVAAINFMENLPRMRSEYWEQAIVTRKELETVKKRSIAKLPQRFETAEQIQDILKATTQDKESMEKAHEDVSYLKQYGEFIGRTQSQESQDCLIDSKDVELIHDSLLKNLTKKEETLKQTYEKKVSEGMQKELQALDDAHSNKYKEIMEWADMKLGELFEPGITKEKIDRLIGTDIRKKLDCVSSEMAKTSAYLQEKRYGGIQRVLKRVGELQDMLEELKNKALQVKERIS